MAITFIIVTLFIIVPNGKQPRSPPWLSGLKGNIYAKHIDDSQQHPEWKSDLKAGSSHTKFLKTNLYWQKAN